VSERFTRSASKVLVLAESAARHLNRSSIGPELLLAGCVQMKDGLATKAMAACGVTSDRLFQELERRRRPSPDADAAVPRIDEDASWILATAAADARERGHDYVDGDDVFTALLRHVYTIGDRTSELSLLLRQLQVTQLALRLAAEEHAIGDRSISLRRLPTIPGSAVRVSAGTSNSLGLKPGVTLGGRYRLDEQIGGGGMGDVWRGTDEVLGRAVAVKIMRPDMLDEAGFAERFRAEARSMATIKHPGVVDVYDYGSDQAVAFIVMEFVEGDPLSHTLKRVGRLTPARTMALVAQAADALESAHQNGIVHRDVKPGNLLVRPNGSLVLSDFGIALSSFVAGLTAPSAVLGTAAYISPEQATGATATPLSDVYSLGVVAYHCLSGQRPFDGANPLAIALQHVTEVQRALPADIPAPVRAIVDRCMAKDPQARWPSAAALAAVARQAARTLTTPDRGRFRGVAASTPPKVASADTSLTGRLRSLVRVRRSTTQVTPSSVAVETSGIDSRLPIARHSTAVLIGAPRYDDTELSDIPAARNNVADLSARLCDSLLGGFYRRRVHEIVDPTMDLVGSVHGLIEAATDTVVVYYAGHGFVGPDGRLYLGQSGTRNDRIPYTSIAYDKLREAILDSRATNRVVILDCCFSGRAVDAMTGGGHLNGQLDIEGTYLLTATPPTQLAHAPIGDRNSVFTGALLSILGEGLPTPHELLPLRDIYEPIRAAMNRKGLPLPQQRGTNTTGHLALTRNPAHAA
jgi:serine/threonine protein kinase